MAKGELKEWESPNPYMRPPHSEIEASVQAGIPRWQAELPESVNIWDDPEPLKQEKGYQAPEDFDFPCSWEWRCGYSGEPYEPDARDIARAKQMEADMTRLVGREYVVCPYNWKYRPTH